MNSHPITTKVDTDLAKKPAVVIPLRGTGNGDNKTKEKSTIKKPTPQGPPIYDRPIFKAKEYDFL